MAITKPLPPYYAHGMPVPSDKIDVRVKVSKYFKQRIQAIEAHQMMCFAAFKNHCGFYPMSPEVLQQFIQHLSEYETAKGTIRFNPQKPIPGTLVEKIVKPCLEELIK